MSSTNFQILFSKRYAGRFRAYRKEQDWDE